MTYVGFLTLFLLAPLLGWAWRRPDVARPGIRDVGIALGAAAYATPWIVWSNFVQTGADRSVASFPVEPFVAAALWVLVGLAVARLVHPRVPQAQFDGSIHGGVLRSVAIVWLLIGAALLWIGRPQRTVWVRS